MDTSPDREDQAFVTAWAPEPEVVVDINAVEAETAVESDIVAYLAVLHAEILELKRDVQILRQETKAPIDVR